MAPTLSTPGLSAFHLSPTKFSSDVCVVYERRDIDPAIPEFSRGFLIRKPEPIELAKFEAIQLVTHGSDMSVVYMLTMLLW